MSMSGAGTARVGRRGRRRRLRMSDINVTPLVDVMLVLLVIFIVTTPALKETPKGIEVDLPKAKGSGSGSSSANTLSVVIDATGKVHFAGQSLELGSVETQLPALLKEYEKQIVTLKAHRQLSYDSVAKVLSIMKGAGVNVSLAVDAPKK
jgi:biopolymer transport protein ExbD